MEKKGLPFHVKSTESIQSASCTTNRSAFITKLENGLTIANVHLCGGRYDDLNSDWDGRKELFDRVVDKKPDIICGDFNVDIVSYMNNEISPGVKAYYEKISKPPDGILTLFDKATKEHGYRFVPNKEITSYYMNTPDGILYNPEKVQLIQYGIIDMGAKINGEMDMQGTPSPRPFPAKDEAFVDNVHANPKRSYSDHDGVFAKFSIIDPTSVLDLLGGKSRRKRTKRRKSTKKRRHTKKRRAGKSS